MKDNQLTFAQLHLFLYKNVIKQRNSEDIVIIMSAISVCLHTATEEKHVSTSAEFFCCFTMSLTNRLYFLLMISEGNDQFLTVNTAVSCSHFKLIKSPSQITLVAMGKKLQLFTIFNKSHQKKTKWKLNNSYLHQNLLLTSQIYWSYLKI